MGLGLLHARLWKQALNSKSSTETKLIGGSDYLPYALWHIYFFKAQSYDMKCKILYQDNESTIKLFKNGKRSSGKQTRHIDIRYFWIADRLKKEDIRVEYCLTECMIGDFFTKLLGGSLFNTTRDISQGYLPITKLSKRHKLKQENEQKQIDNVNDSIVHKERVEGKIQNKLTDG